MFDQPAFAPVTIGAPYEGFARIREVGPVGMITLRCAHDAPSLAAALRTIGGTDLPDRRRILRQGGRAVAWMSPDELLIVLPHLDVAAALDALKAGLADTHHLAVDVSDARCVFRIEGERADQVIAKLSPADLDAMAEGEIRRTRAAQVACAFWREDGGFTLVAFRSVAAYVRGILENAARPGSELHG